MAIKSMMIRLAIFLLAATAFAQSPSIPSGSWRTRGYGYILDSTPAGVNVYEVTRSTCRLTDFVKAADFSQAFGDVHHEQNGRVLLEGSDKNIEIERAVFSPSNCANRDAIDPDPLHSFNVLWETFNENYPFFRERNIDWPAVRREYQPKIAALGPHGDPWDLFTEILSGFHDAHIHLVDGARRFQSVRAPADEPKTADLQSGLKAYLASPGGPLHGQLREAAYGRLLYGPVNSDIAYIAVLTMGGFSHGPAGWPGNTTAKEDNAAAAAAFRHALDDLGEKKTLILDLRYNPGGSDQISDLIAGFFADRRRLAFTFRARDGQSFGVLNSRYVTPGAYRFRGMLIILTSQHTTSAAESLVMRLRVLPQVLVIGQSTQGAHSDVLSRTLPNGWRLDLSNEVYRLPDGRIYEGVGIPPNILVPLDPKDRYGRDIKSAIDQLHS